MTFWAINNWNCLLAALCMLFISTTMTAQCPDGRLTTNLYNYERDTVLYGSNTTVLQDTVDLYMDIFHPVGDTFSKRPVIIFAFGGGFVSGDRNDFIMSNLCQMYAEKGWVAATMDYRLFPQSQLGSPDSFELIDANIKAVGDMRAAIRYLRRSADESNPYRIDPDFFVVGGYSAGAFTALNLSYLNEEDEIPTHIEEIIEQNGGLEGNTGDSTHLSYSSQVNACVNFAGALYDTSFLDAGEPPLFSYHGTEDDVVPISSGISVSTVNTQGSELIAQRATNEGVMNVFHPIQGAGHLSIWIMPTELSGFLSTMDGILRDMYCENPTAVVRPEIQKEFIIFPNPAINSITIQLDNAMDEVQPNYRIISSKGQVVSEGRIVSQKQSLDLSGISPGLYWVELPFHAPRSFIIL